MRVCLLYDCLYPYTIGGAERWYRNLAERLAGAGHDVTFLTLRQWDRDDPPEIPGVRVLAVGPRSGLYARSGRRRVLPALAFGMGVLRHLMRHGSGYDVVHTASFPYFSLLAAAATRRRARPLVVDWHEVWTQAYWREYLGPVAGRVGWWVQGRCLRVRQRAFCFSTLHERRLHELGLHGDVTRLEGQYVGSSEPTPPEPARPVAVFAGRHIPEKRVLALVPALVRARERIPELRGELYGDGPERAKVLQSIAERGVGGWLSAPGFVDEAVLERAMTSALCLVLPSTREGYGLVVVESAARGVPVVVVEGPDNAATELVVDGVNGAIASSAAPHELADAILRVHRAGSALRASTADWFRENAPRLALGRSLTTVLETYARD